MKICTCFSLDYLKQNDKDISGLIKFVKNLLNNHVEISSFFKNYFKFIACRNSNKFFLHCEARDAFPSESPLGCSSPFTTFFIRALVISTVRYIERAGSTKNFLMDSLRRLRPRPRSTQYRVSILSSEF